MSDVPGDGGDDDSHSHTHDKPGGTEAGRNVKRTKNTWEKKDEKEISNSQ
jgi:hypothetical protein